MCAIVCVSLHLSLINFSLRHGSPEKFLANTKKTKNKLTFFNWMLRNEWKDKNHLGKKRLSYSNKTIVWNVEKKEQKNYCILFSVSKDYLFRLWYFHGMEFIAKQWNLQAIHFFFVHKQLQQNAAHQLPICHIERSLSFTLSLSVCDYFTLVRNSMNNNTVWHWQSTPSTRNIILIIHLSIVDIVLRWTQQH